MRWRSTPIRCCHQRGGADPSVRNAGAGVFRCGANANALAIDAGAVIDVSGGDISADTLLATLLPMLLQARRAAATAGLGVDVGGAANPVYGDYRNPNELGSGNAGYDADSGGGLARITAGARGLTGAISG